MRRSSRIPLFLLLSGLVLAQAAPEVEITAEPHHHLVFKNEELRVFSVEVPPHAETLMHWHRHDYIYVTLGATEVVNAVEGKDAITLKLQDGETRFTPRNFAHIARNVSDRPFRNVTIEILRDEKRGQAASTWDDDRGLQILEGGTKEILFVKDGIRVSEVELQHEGILPLSDGPFFVVALTDHVRLMQGRPQPNHTMSFSIMVRLDTGGVQWVAAGHQKDLLCAGPAAKFVLLEFPRS